jgi:tetraacyldisaccharide 4'-kinase
VALAQTFREVVSGQRKGPMAVLLRGLLRVVECPYTLVVRIRNWRYHTGRAKIHRAGVPVVCVGNLTLGGTGKTPMIAQLARWFAERDVNVAIVSRGYKSTDGSTNDEALELAQRLPDVPHVQNPDRVAGAQTAIQEHGAQLILLDDGYQHRRLHRDLDLVMIDALEPFGFEHVFPRGTLREPLAGLQRAKIVALSRANLIDESQRKGIRKRLQPLAPGAVWIEVAHMPQALICSSGKRAELNELSGKRIAAFCGLGNPQGFKATLENLGYDVCGFREFPDHHAYAADDITSLATWADELRADALVCTHKDLVKLASDQIGNRPLWAVEIGIELLAGGELLENALQPLVEM